MEDEFSSSLEGADITVVITKHEVDSQVKILNSAPYVFDTTGTIFGAHTL